MSPGESGNEERTFFDDLACGRDVWFRARGGSMRPCLRDGDLLLLVPRDYGQLRSGDLVLMKDGSRVVLHRLLARRAGWILTKGDTLEEPDAPWPEPAFHARAEARLEHGRLRSLRSPGWRVYGQLLARAAPLIGPGLKRLRQLKALFRSR